MRRFSSYGPVDAEEHYYAPRKELIEKAFTQLVGDNPGPGKTGHYITVWAPRQTGKTWTMQQILFRLRKDPRFIVLKINLEHLKYETNTDIILSNIAREIGEGLNKSLPDVTSPAQFQEIFKNTSLDKPLILIMDEFDALCETAINAMVGAFRNIYTKLMDELDKPAEQKTYRLYAVALIGVRSVLGIDNTKGSPFNIQRSVHIPNLTYDEVLGMFQWYKKESGQKVDTDVVQRVYDETRGQPGLTCWLGELLTETYNHDKSKPITLTHFEEAHAAAAQVLPNNNILNLISKVKKTPHREWVLDLFKTTEKIPFKFDDEIINYLYMNGIIDEEKVGQTRYFVKFSCPFVQTRLFNYFSHELFKEMGSLVDPFTNMDNVISDKDLNIPNILKLYQAYLEKNKQWLFKAVPRRNDMRVYEAVYHFNLFSYLDAFLRNPGGRVYPEFPTGNGKIDLIITYEGNRYGLELKSFTNEREYRTALERAAHYGKQLGLPVIYLVFFIDYIDAANREKFEKKYIDKKTNTTVVPVFIIGGI